MHFWAAVTYPYLILQEHQPFSSLTLTLISLDDTGAVLRVRCVPSPPGLDPRCSSPTQGAAPYFTPIASGDSREKVDILELLHKAKIDLKPLLSTLSVNKARLRESSEYPFIV